MNQPDTKADPERVVPLELGVRWDPNADDALLMHQGRSATLQLRPNIEDLDHRWLMLRWDGCSGALLSGPNDEARSGHRLWDHGLSDCLWAAEVLGSRWVADLASVNSVHPYHRPESYRALRHVIILLKDATFECVAESWRIERIPVPLNPLGA